MKEAGPKLKNDVTVDPIAVIGIACRFPGAPNISEFWQLLAAGRNLVVEGPPGSVIGRSGEQFPKFDSESSALRFGAFVEDIDFFDAEFFRISPLEAQLLDPQQRMMLETSWQALEDAAIDPSSLRGSRTGVYAGISAYDYRDVALDSPETAEPAGGLYAVTGTSLNTAVGRVSFALGLEGPNMAIDTACSSSLVAVHQAVTGLHRGETDLAIAGGVHVNLAGRTLELRANAGMLSPEGQCKTFDASADGFVCGEGCGLLILKRLSEAEADGDRIWAVIRGSSVNQDGASQGLTVPSGRSQERAMEEALARAGICPSETDYLEAHGTGTVVGDPIEVNAAAAVYGRGREDARPLLIGSVKTNIGHLGPAAGVAGLIKTVLSMRSGHIPRHLNFKNPNPRLDWERLPVRVTDAKMDWPCRADKLPVAGVNSFGWSGTNAHVLLQGYGSRNSANAKFLPPAGSAMPANGTRQLRNAPGERKTRFLPLSGKSDKAVRDLASRYLSWLDENIEQASSDITASHPILSDLVWTASIGRSHFQNRSAIVFRDVVGLREELEKLAIEKLQDAGPGRRQTAKAAFVFTGQASQWVGMGENLYETEPVFRPVLDQCDCLLFEERGTSLLDVMFGRNGSDGLLDEPAWTQPAIYALECALTALWQSVGISPSVVIGHSLGEIAAAQAAGVFTLEEGLRYAARRGELMGATRSDGAMAAIFAPAARVASAVADHNANSDDAGISIAVDNGLQQVVSGPAKGIEAILSLFESEDVKVSRLKRSPAYHSALVETALDDLEAVLNDIVSHPPPASVPLISNVTGQVLDEDDRMDAAYWRRHAREPVAFQSSVETLAEMGVDAVVEIGPHAVLGPLVSMIWPASSPAKTPVVIHSLRRPPQAGEEPMVDTSGGFVDAVASAYEAGFDITFNELFSGEMRRRISLPGYQFQRERHWVQVSKHRRQAAGHPLLGAMHESPRGEIMFASEIFPSDPAWLKDHLVFGRVVAPGGLYGAMAVCASLTQGDSPAIVDEMQIYSALILEDEDNDSEANGSGRKLQLVLASVSDNATRQFEIFSKGRSDESWVLHAAGKLRSNPSDFDMPAFADIMEVKSALAPQDTGQFYEMRSADQIYLGPAYHTLKALWGRAGEAFGELVLQDTVDASGMEMHPLLVDGCFQVLSIARYLTGVEQGAVYMPFGWERLWVAGSMPERIFCHAILRSPSQDSKSGQASVAPPEVVTGDVSFYSTAGTPIGELKGFTVKRATQGALLPSAEGHKHLFYEVNWKKQSLGGMSSSHCLASPKAIVSRLPNFTDYLAGEGVAATDWVEFLSDQERLTQAFSLAALEQLGWQRKSGKVIRPDELRKQLEVIDCHKRLFARILDMLTAGGILEQHEEGFVINIESGEPLPSDNLGNPQSLYEQLVAKHPHGFHELGLLNQCGSALAEVLRGRIDPLTLLFSDDGPNAADLYLHAPAPRAANRMLKDAVEVAIGDLPADRRLRVIEVGAGTGSATLSILPVLPLDRVHYVFTDISAGFFGQAESRLSEFDVDLEYKPLNIEEPPESQGFDLHAYDLVVAANVLHATRDLGESLHHCQNLLASSGQLIALEIFHRRSWADLTFGLLDGWWRFSDAYRPDYALAPAPVWRKALGDAGFSETDFLGPDNPDSEESLGSSVILAQKPRQPEVTQSPGIWVVADDESGIAHQLAAELESRNQTVILACKEGRQVDDAVESANVIASTVEPGRRESWQRLLLEMPRDVPFKGVVALAALDGRSKDASTQEMSDDITRIMSTALALVQGVIDSRLVPTEGIWLVTQGGQVLQQDMLDGKSGELAGAGLWGFGKVASLESPHLQPRMIDLDPREARSADLVDELLYPGSETHIAYRGTERYVARLERGDIRERRLVVPENSKWWIGPDDHKSGLAAIQIKPRADYPLEPGEVRIAVEATGLNFADVLISMGSVEIDQDIGLEFYGQILETAWDIENFSAGDPVVGMGFGAFAPVVTTRASLVTHAPAGYSGTSLATVPICFTTAELAFAFAGLRAGDRVLIHAGAGGVGLAAIQLANAAGVEVFATASVAKQAFLRALGVEHVFDSRQTKFGNEILNATGGQGVDMVLNSLTSEGFIEASLSCLGTDGCFVEIAKRNILSKQQMSEKRPDVAYSTINLDILKKEDSPVVGAAFSRVMKRLSTGELTPLPHTVWPLADIRSAMTVMREARHVGKIVLRNPPLAGSRLRQDRTYLVTGGMGGIGCLVADWLTERGAGTIVLNGRRGPDTAADENIQELRARGVNVCVEIADVADAAAVDSMLARIDASLPPLGGIIHSVGVLYDGVIENQTWGQFKRVMWPKMLGAWHLHQATRSRDLDLFVLFSSATGVVGNAGQSNHASSNAFLDQLAVHRRSLGLPGQVIAWGAWSGIGEAAEQRERIERQLSDRGARWLTPQQGMDAFDWIVRQDVTSSTIINLDWSQLASESDAYPPFLETLIKPTQIEQEIIAKTTSSTDILTQFRNVSANARTEMLEVFIQTEVQSVLRLSSPPSTAVSFFDLGMDSLMAVQLRNRLNQAFADEYTSSNTVIFDYPNVSALAAHLSIELEKTCIAAQPSRPIESVKVKSQARNPENNLIAIVGMACRLPGASDLAAYWRQLEAGECAVTDGRRDSGLWDGAVGDPKAEVAVLRTGGFIDGLDRFDAKFFDIRPIDARNMDPQQRLLLETSWHALEDAGIDATTLRGSHSGVYFGVANSEYRDLMKEGVSEVYYGNTLGAIVGRVSYMFGLEGPAIPVEVACASSIVAIHNAVVALQREETDLALAGGVNAILSIDSTGWMADLGILSRAGWSRPFDETADGYVRSEGCGVVVLKRLEDAEADGDRIWGVIRGSAINQNGESGGFTMPSGPAQRRVIEEALARANLDASEVDYVEAHANGSNMGDAIEVQAISEAYGGGRDLDRPLLLGTVKGNIGHLESAAGVAGLIKVMLAIRSGSIPKQLTFESPNSNIDWKGIPVRIASETTPWPLAGNRPPRAGISAFAMTGTNAHMIVEGYGDLSNGPSGNDVTRHPVGTPQRVAAPVHESVAELTLPSAQELTQRRSRLLPLSAKSDIALREQAARYIAWLEERIGEFSSSEIEQSILPDMAWTASVGRSHFEQRAAIVFESVSSLREGLRTVAESDRKHDYQAATKIAFAYAAHDVNWPGMGKELYESEPVVRGVLDYCEQGILQQQNQSLLRMMFGDADGLKSPVWSQLAAFVLQCALTALWSSNGIRPDVAVSAGAGALAAAYSAGVLTLEEGLRLAMNRMQLEQTSSGSENWSEAGISFEYPPPSISLVNQITGRLVEAGDQLDEACWRGQACEPAAFARSVSTIMGLGVDTVVEISADAALGPQIGSNWLKLARDCASDEPGSRLPLVVSSQTRPSAAGEAPEKGFVNALAQLYNAGLNPNFKGLFAGEDRCRISLPNYPFQRQRFWFNDYL